jgi:hypothetical protein
MKIATMVAAASRRLMAVALALLLVAGIACRDDDDPDTLADLECDDLIAEIYDDCHSKLPPCDGVRPEDEDARRYCRDDERYDWQCIDDCVFDYKGLCSTLAMCLEDCPLKD